MLSKFKITSLRDGSFTTRLGHNRIQNRTEPIALTQIYESEIRRLQAEKWRILKHASSEKQVMVDPNTALPMQWPNQQQVSMSHSQVYATSAVATSQMLRARAVESKPRSSHHEQKTALKMA